MVFDSQSATVQQAAETIGVNPAQIAKTLSFRGEATVCFTFFRAYVQVEEYKTITQAVMFTACVI